MDTHGSVVPSQPILVEPRINKRRDRSPGETSDGRDDNSRGMTIRAILLYRDTKREVVQQ